MNRFPYNFKSISVTAPSDALVTCAAYFASTLIQKMSQTRTEFL